MKVALIKNKNRNSSISIGANVIINELQNGMIKVDVIDWSQAINYDIVMISITATNDLFDLLTNMIKFKFHKRKFKVIIGGFGVQNIIPYKGYVDYAFFGRADGIITQIINEIYNESSQEYEFLYDFAKPSKVKLRQVSELYPHQVRYGKNNTIWTEKFIGCPFRCKFCHYSHNRKLVSPSNTYINDGLSAGSPEIMAKDMRNISQKLGRFTTALDGYSERLRFKFGKKISWDLFEEGLDNVLSFKGNTFIKLYNIHNFPTETQEDVDEFFNFFKEYCEHTEKADGVVTIEILNTAFRPSLNTPMERCPAKLYPEARYENNQIAIGKGVIVKFSNFNSDAYTHLLDLISIRYADKHKDLLNYILLDKDFNKKNNMSKIDTILSKFDISDFIREYSADEFIIDIFITE